MIDYIIQYLRSMDEPEMAREVSAMQSRLNAFEQGLDKECSRVLRESADLCADAIEAARRVIEAFDALEPSNPSRYDPLYINGLRNVVARAEAAK